MVRSLLVFLSFSTFFVTCVVMSQVSESDLLLVVTEEWAPYSYKQADGKIVGSSTAVVEQTLRNSDIPYTLNLYPWARSYELALTTPNVLLYSTIRTPEREDLFHWVCPLNSVEYFIFKLESRKDIVINSLNDLKEYSIGVTRGTFLTDFFKQKGLIEGTHLQLTGDNQANLKNLLSSRVDLIIDTQEYIDAHLDKKNIKANYVRSTYHLNAEMDGINNTCMAISLKTPMVVVDKIRNEHRKLRDKAQD